MPRITKRTIKLSRVDVFEVSKKKEKNQFLSVRLEAEDIINL